MPDNPMPVRPIATGTFATSAPAVSMAELGQYVHKRRICKKLSREALAANTDITVAELTSIEFGRAPVERDVIRLLADALDCDAGELTTFQPQLSTTLRPGSSGRRYRQE